MVAGTPGGARMYGSVLLRSRKRLQTQSLRIHKVYYGSRLFWLHQPRNPIAAEAQQHDRHPLAGSGQQGEQIFSRCRRDSFFVPRTLGFHSTIAPRFSFLQCRNQSAPVRTSHPSGSRRSSGASPDDAPARHGGPRKPSVPYACPCHTARADGRSVVARRRGFGHQPLVAHGRGEPVKALASSKSLSCRWPFQDPCSGDGAAGVKGGLPGSPAQRTLVRATVI